jgi:hypothetical protein
VNRRQRRANGQHRPGCADIAKQAACPDCTADVVVTEVAPKVFRGDVYHDESCPWLAKFQRDGGLGVRIFKEQP